MMALGRATPGSAAYFFWKSVSCVPALGGGQAPGQTGGHVEISAGVDLCLVLAHRQRAAAVHDIAEGLGAARGLRGAALGREGHLHLREFRAHGFVDENHRRGTRDARHRAVDVVARRDERVAGGDAGAGVAKKVGHGQRGVGRKN